MTSVVLRSAMKDIRSVFKPGTLQTQGNLPSFGLLIRIQLIFNHNTVQNMLLQLAQNYL
jgi:hypothetical protein